MTHPLAGVSGAYNAVFLESEAFDKIMLYGPGAGSVPTASAVIGDVISVVNTAKGSFTHNCLCYKDRAFFSERRRRLDASSCASASTDRPACLARVTSVFGEEGVSIKSMVQEGGGEAAELVFLLHKAPEARFFAALERLLALDEVQGEPGVIRVEE